MAISLFRYILVGHALQNPAKYAFSENFFHKLHYLAAAMGLYVITATLKSERRATMAV